VFKWLKRAVRKIVAFVRRLVTKRYKNEYERILFEATYAIGYQFRKGLMA